MNYDIAKQNRLNGKFNFKPRDWQVELDGVEETARVPLKTGRPRKAKVVWERGEGGEQDALHEEAHAG